MKIFSKVYERLLIWSVHRHAPYYLMGISFVEASFFPIPPDVMLAPMSLAKPERAWHYAFITTLFSVIGGVFGYCIGLLGWALIQPWIVKLGYLPAYEQAHLWFQTYGFWAVIIAGFTPIPYKIFTITAGATLMPFFPFILAACIGRSARFFLVAGLMRWGGEKMRDGLGQVVDWAGWGVLMLVFVIILFYSLH